MIFLKSINCYSLHDQRAFILSHALSNPQVINVKLVQTKLWKGGKHKEVLIFGVFFIFFVDFLFQFHFDGKCEPNTPQVKQETFQKTEWPIKADVKYSIMETSWATSNVTFIKYWISFVKKSWNMLNSKSFFHAWFVQKIESESSVVKTFTI